MITGLPRLNRYNYDSSVLGYRLTTSWTLRGSNPSGVEIFRTRPKQPWVPPSLLHKATGRDAVHTPLLALKLRMSRALPLLPL
jgi:hypothetical protein